MDALIKVLPSILRAAGKSNEVTEALCIVAWNHAVGDALRQNAVPLRLEQRILIVAVSDRVWQKQLQAMTGHLLSRVNAVLGERMVKGIDLRIDPEVIEKFREPHRGLQNTHSEIPEDLLLPASRIEDPQLRRLFLGAATSCLDRLKNLEPRG